MAHADRFLMMPDFFHWLLCGSRVVEFTNATTTQFFHPTNRDWAFDLLRKFDVPTHIFPEVVPPGTKLGTLRDDVIVRTGLKKIEVVAPATHDTGAAVAAVPTQNTGQGELGLHQLGHVVADRCRGAGRRPRHGGTGAERHERRGHRRDVSPAQERDGALAGAGVPPFVRAQGSQVRVRRTGEARRGCGAVPDAGRSRTIMRSSARTTWRPRSRTGAARTVSRCRRPMANSSAVPGKSRLQVPISAEGDRRADRREHRSDPRRRRRGEERDS